jgi:hypothetical protein
MRGLDPHHPEGRGEASRDSMESCGNSYHCWLDLRRRTAYRTTILVGCSGGPGLKLAGARCGCARNTTRRTRSDAWIL